MYLFKNSLIALFSVALIFGCTKESIDPKSQSGSNIDVTSSTISSNYSWLGELHNKALEEIGKHSDFPNSTAAQKDSIIEVTFENSPHVDSLDLNLLTQARNNIDYILQNSFSQIVDDLNDSGNVDSDVASMLLSINNAIDSSSTLNEALDNLNSLESEVESSDALTTEEKNGIIGGIIIARHSSSFWSSAVSESENNWYSVVISETGGSDDYQALFGRIKADVKGYVRAFFDKTGKIKDRHEAGLTWGGVLSDVASAS